METELQDARTLTHGSYEDVIVVEYRARPGARSEPLHAQQPASGDAPYVVLELQDGTRVIDRATRFEVDGAFGAPPSVGQTYRIIVSARGATPDPGDLTLSGSLRYESARTPR